MLHAPLPGGNDRKHRSPKNPGGDDFNVLSRWIEVRGRKTQCAKHKPEAQARISRFETLARASG
ncbi:MAG TPA: hypothetical protein DD670_20440 [Planctomycetaceae bacterium]|nr:hypothetical protein [Planctomycetaceae bacterium]